MRAVIFTSIICILFGSPGVFSQDPEFTQFYANPLYLNPAFAGSAQCPRLILNYRNQWPGIENAFQTYSGSFDQYVKSISGGLALQLVHDGSGKGTYQTTSISLAYAYHTPITKKVSLSAGLKFGFLQKSIDWEALTYGDMIDKNEGFIYESSEQVGVNARSNVDFSAGAMAFSDRAFLGFSVSHLAQPKIGLTDNQARLMRRFIGHVGISIPVGGENIKDFSLSPNILYSYQNSFQQLNVGLYAKKGVLTAGAWYRSDDAMIILLGVETSKYKIGYSYDVTISEIADNSAGAHEVSFTFQFPCMAKKERYSGENCKAQVQLPRKRKKFSMVNCPSF